MNNLKLWYSPGACSLAPHIILEESGLSYERHCSDVHQGVSAELKAINPKAQVPVLEMNGELVTEVSAIITAISQLVPDRRFLGGNNLDVVRSYEWFSYLSVAMHKQAFGGIFRPGRFSNDAASHDGIRKQCRENVIDCFRAVEQQLVSKHLVGGDFTAADAYFFVFYRWAVMFLKLDMSTEFPKCTAVVEEVIKRPAVVAVLTAEGIEASS